jgi:uncharacterized protein
MALKNVKTTDWGLSLKEQGNTVDGVFDIHQCIYIILSTIKGTDPFRPTFGCDIYQYIDKPVSSALPNMVRSVIDALTTWEPRIEVQQVRTSLTDNSTVLFQIQWTLTESSISQITDFELFMSGNAGAAYAPTTRVFTYIATESDIILTDENGKSIYIK